MRTPIRKESNDVPPERPSWPRSRPASLGQFMAVGVDPAAGPVCGNRSG
jgi:hypothetical protein